MSGRSERYEVVFCCYLRDGTPEWVMAALWWHLGVGAELPEGLDDLDGQLYALIVPDHYANRRVPGGDVVSLRREVQEFTRSGKRYEWELFSRNGWINDFMYYLDTEVTVFDFHDGTYEPIKRWGVDPL
ncbi:hypothetical protein ACFVW1_11705 [Streptomyces olivochromogenes]|uniref:hypothetical protein n=1 Tax=Streptomyces olivochromogenes TaxID=1963 RepID=UPI0036DE795C